MLHTIELNKAKIIRRPFFLSESGKFSDNWEWEVNSTIDNTPIEISAIMTSGNKYNLRLNLKNNLIRKHPHFKDLIKIVREKLRPILLFTIPLDLPTRFPIIFTLEVKDKRS